jgi:hypothetical protein
MFAMNIRSHLVIRNSPPVSSDNFMYTSCACLEEFEDTKGVIRIRISNKIRQHNGQKEKCKRTNNDLQNIHIKLKIE